MPLRASTARTAALVLLAALSAASCHPKKTTTPDPAEELRKARAAFVPFLTEQGFEQLESVSSIWEVGEIVDLHRAGDDGGWVRSDPTCLAQSVIANYNELHVGHGPAMTLEAQRGISGYFALTIKNALKVKGETEEAYSVTVSVTGVKIAEWAKEFRLKSRVSSSCHAALTPSVPGRALVAGVLFATVRIDVRRSDNRAVEVATADALSTALGVAVGAGFSVTNDGHATFSADDLAIGIRPDTDAPTIYANNDPRGDRRVELIVFRPDDEITCSLDGQDIVSLRFPESRSEEAPVVRDITSYVTPNQQHTLHCKVIDRNGGSVYAYKFLVRRSDTGKELASADFSCSANPTCTKPTGVVLDQDYTFTDKSPSN